MMIKELFFSFKFKINISTQIVTLKLVFLSVSQ